MGSKHTRVQNGNRDASALRNVPCQIGLEDRQVPFAATVRVVGKQVWLDLVVKLGEFEVRVVCQLRQHRSFRRIAR